MKFLKFAVLIFIIFSMQCSLFRIKEDIYTDEELTILQKILQTFEYNYGYDSNVELNYIYSYSFSNDNFDKKEKESENVLTNTDLKALRGLYEKLLKLNAMTEYKMNQYKEKTNWKYYTYIKNDLYKPLVQFSSIIKKHLLKRDESLEEVMNDKYAAIKKQVKEHYIQKEEVVDTF